MGIPFSTSKVLTLSYYLLNFPFYCRTFYLVGKCRITIQWRVAHKGTYVRTLVTKYGYRVQVLLVQPVPVGKCRITIQWRVAHKLTCVRTLVTKYGYGIQGLLVQPVPDQCAQSATFVHGSTERK